LSPEITQAQRRELHAQFTSLKVKLSLAPQGPRQEPEDSIYSFPLNSQTRCLTHCEPTRIHRALWEQTVTQPLYKPGAVLEYAATELEKLGGWGRHCGRWNRTHGGSAAGKAMADVLGLSVVGPLYMGMPNPQAQSAD
jgi:hypothetical protein